MYIDLDTCLMNWYSFYERTLCIYNEVNIIITTCNTASKCLGDLIEEYYMREQQHDYFLVIDEAYLLL